MKKTILLFASIIFWHIACQAQKENNVWAFGDSMGIDFNGPNPTVIKTSIRSLGGSASVCDTGGQLLFYTQGDFVWNRNHQLMPNGTGLISPYASNDGTQSSQGQLILPVIGNPTQYYVFSQQAVTDYVYGGDVAASRLFYSVVDMSLDGGLGDIVSSQKAILLDSILTSEKMVAIPGEDCSVWLLVHSVEDNTFKAFHVGDTGIGRAPVISASGNIATPVGYALGKMKVSPDGSRLAVCSWMYGEYGCELFDFDAATGAVSNPRVLDSIPQSLSACFSPDNSKLYVFSFDGGNGALYQYDLSLGNTADIIASATLIDQLGDAGTSVFDARIGPDGKIYVKMPYSGVSGNDTIGRIEFPNTAGTGCGYTRAALISPFRIQLGNGDLPNVFVKPVQDTAFSAIDLSIATGDTLILAAPAGYDAYSWSNGDTASSVTITAAGTYWVSSFSYCSFRTDTFVVTISGGIATAGEREHTLQIFPNPAGEQVTIHIPGRPDPAGTLRITDLTGRTLVSAPADREQIVIPLQNLAAGVYQVIYNRGNRGFSQGKLIITR